MSNLLLYNGSFYTSTKLLFTADNRGLRYGDGLFETLKVNAGTINFANWHFERLFNGLRLLGFEPPAYFNAAYLSAQVIELCKKNNQPCARVRINIVRGNGGLYDPENHFPNCMIQSWPLENTGYTLNENGLVTGIYQDARKAIDTFSNLKSNNFLPYTMAALYAKKQHWNDAILLNTNQTVCDATIANIFIVKNETVYTCPLQDGCIAGIMRRFLAENLPLHGFDYREQTIQVSDLLEADEVFLTNTIRGIRWVKSCEDASYRKHASGLIFERLLENRT